MSSSSCTGGGDSTGAIVVSVDDYVFVDLDGVVRTLALGVTIGLGFGVLVAIAFVLHFAVSTNRAAAATVIVITLTAFIFHASWRVVASSATDWGTAAASATTRRAITAGSARFTTSLTSTAAWLIASRVEPPRCRWWSTSPLECVSVVGCEQQVPITDLNIQKIVTSDALVVHLVVSIISVATALVLHKCKAV